MRKNRLVCMLAGAALCSILLPLESYSEGRFDPSLFSIKVYGNSVRILNEKTSRYKISSSDGEFNLPDIPFQKIAGRTVSGDHASLILTAGDPGEKNGPPAQDDVQNTRFLNLDSPEIINIVKKLKPSKSPVEDAEKFVYEYISHKSYGIPIIPAADIVKARSGDCTEHSVLTVALLRSLGIPARAVVGMVFTDRFEGLKNVFVFHMWVLAYYENKWVLVDSTRPGENHPNRYIAFSYHHLKTEMPLSYLKAISVIKDLKVEIE